eukprot:236580_1
MITTEGPNRLTRKGSPLKPRKHRKKGYKTHRNNNKKKQKKLLSINENSKLRNQLASLRQTTRPIIVNKNNNNKKNKKLKIKKKNNGLVQKFQWNKVKSSKLSFGKQLSKRSLLFSIEEINNKIDKMTIYHIGKSGLDGLCELNPTKFTKYQHSNIFNENENIYDLQYDIAK